MRRNLRYLRIAASGLSLVACALLVLLWLRSYMWKDAFYGRFSVACWFHIISIEGQVTFSQFKASPQRTRVAVITKESVLNLRVPLAPEIRVGPQFGLYTGQFRSERMDGDWRRMKRQLESTLPIRVPATPSYLGFSFRQHARGFEVGAPHWFLAVVVATLAALPWTKRRYRFSLRTLLVVTTFIALILGIAMIGK